MQDYRTDRRAFMVSAASLLGFSGRPVVAAGAFSRPLGVQLYTLRSVLGEAEDETLRRISEIGYTEVETTSRDDLDKLGPILSKYNLKPISSHLSGAVVTGVWPEGSTHSTLAQAIDTAKKHGVEYLVFPYLPPGERDDAESYRRLADKLNLAGRQVHAAGLTFCYHNHAFEFSGNLGDRPIDIMNERLDPRLVNFELDVFWISVSGADPMDLMNKFKGRVPLLHLKDKNGETPRRFDEKVKKDAFKEVGSGMLDFQAILQTAETVGVKHYLVEQDQTPGDPVNSLAKSYKFLRTLQL